MLRSRISVPPAESIVENFFSSEYSLAEAEDIAREAASCYNPDQDEFSLRSLPIARSFYCSTDLEDQLSYASLTYNQLQSGLNSNFLDPIIRTMRERPKTFRAPLSLIFSARENGSHGDMPSANFNVRTRHAGWFLCSSAEDKFRKSLKDQSYVTIENDDGPYMLVKFAGKMAGMCVRTVQNASGKALIEGTWYCPVSADSRRELNEKFDVGRQRTTLDGAEWVLMRCLSGDDRNSTENLLAYAKRRAQDAPQLGRSRLPHGPGTVSRRLYRDYRHAGEAT